MRLLAVTLVIIACIVAAACLAGHRALRLEDASARSHLPLALATDGQSSRAA